MIITKLRFFAILLVLLISGTAGTIRAQDKPKFTAFIEVNVDSSDPDQEKQVLGEVSKQLSEIADVTITGAGRSDYLVQLFFKRVDSADVKIPYYAMTASVGKQADCVYRHTLVDGKPLVEPCLAVLYFDTITLATGKGLRMKIADLVHTIDTTILQKDRDRFAGKKRSLADLTN